MNKTLFSLLTFLLLSLYGQAAPYTFQRLGVRDGLTNNYVWKLTQDDNGYIWIATDYGLNRFDGGRFTGFTQLNSTLPGNNIQSVFYDKTDNKLWIGGAFLGFCAMDLTDNQIQHYTFEKGYWISNAKEFCQAKDGGLWVACEYGGILYYDRRNHSFRTLDELGIKGLVRTAFSVCDDGQGRLYIGHAHEGFSVVDLRRKTIRHFTEAGKEGLPGNSVYHIFIDSQRNIWLGTNKGLALYHPQTNAFTVFTHKEGVKGSLLADHVYDIKEMTGNVLWIGSDIGGISLLDLKTFSANHPKSNLFSYIYADNTEHGLSSKNIRSFLQDKFGNIWIGNYSSGLDFIGHIHPVFQILPDFMEEGTLLTYKPAWGLWEENGRIWIGGENEVSVFQQGERLKTYNLSPYLPRTYGQVSSIAPVSNGQFLLGLYDNGLLLLDTRTGDVHPVKMDKPYIDITSLSRRRSGGWWVSTENGVYSFHDGKLYKEEIINRLLKSPYVSSVVEDKTGSVWVGTQGGGITIIKGNRRWKSFEGDGTLNVINQLYMDRKGEIWIASNIGLGHIPDTAHPERYSLYAEKEGLTDLTVKAVTEDRQGQIWISTNNELCYWRPATQSFAKFDYKDGLPQGNFTPQSVGRLKDGTLLFGSLTGVCYFNPQSAVSGKTLSPVRISGMESVQGNSGSKFEACIPRDGKVFLTYDQNTFRVSFAVPDFALQGKVEYAYQMEGLDDKWQSVGEDENITFRNIAPGHYTLRVRARMKNGVWDDSHTDSLRIVVAPPFYRSWWAYCLYLLLIIYGTYYALRRYKRGLKLKGELLVEQKKRQDEEDLNNERMRFFTNIAHELRTPLTLIVGPLEDLEEDVKLPKPYKRTIHVIHESAQRLAGLINGILDFRKTETSNRPLVVTHGNLSEFVTETGLRFLELERSDKVDLRMEVESDCVCFFDAEIITSVLNNLLSNAFKYTPEGNITLYLRVKREDNKVELGVKDTGYGIPQAALSHVFERYYQAGGRHQMPGTGIGLALVKALVTLHKGTVEVKSTEGEGADFTITLPLKETYPNAVHKEKPQTEKADVPSDNIQENAEEKPVVLVVEDNAPIRSYIQTSLAKDYQVITAANGKEGLEKALKAIPDLVVSDVMMPEMNGIAMCKCLKNDVRTSHIPVVLLTAKDTLSDKEEGYDSGADSYLTKPFSAKLLRTRLRNIMEMRRALATHWKEQWKVDDSVAEKDTTPKLTPLDAKFMETLTKLVEDNLTNEKLDVNFLATSVHMSVSTLYRKLKSLTGISGNEFIRKVRLKRGLQLLKEGGYNVSEAAYGCGFSDPAYFRNCFKEEYGCSPSAYKKL